MSSTAAPLRRIAGSQVGVLTIALLVSAACAPQLEVASIRGAWRLVHAEERDSSGKPSVKPVQSGFAFFTNNHYAVIWSQGSAPAAPFATPWAPTDAERLERFDAFTANAGTYQISGSTLTATPAVAKVPDFMGGSATYDFTLEGDTLSLTYVRVVSRQGVPMSMYESGGRFEYRFVRLEK